MKIAKRQRRQFYRAMQSLRRGIADRSPQWARRAFGPVVDYIDMLLVDHGIFRVIYANKHRISDDAWRASQPTPYQIRAYARQGIRTILNLRGVRDCGSFRLEDVACDRYGIKLVNFPVKSRALPPREVLHQARALLDEIEYPMLMHCKSGADRVGLMSVLYVFLREREAMEKAVDQLHWRYGHFRQADTGVLDYFFETYMKSRNGRTDDTAEISAFFNWVDENYDPDDIKRAFKAQTWANTLVNTILRRE